MRLSERPEIPVIRGTDCGTDLVTVEPEDPVDEAVRRMRERAVLPVVGADRLVGVVSAGGLVIEKDPTSAPADISEAPPND